MDVNCKEFLKSWIDHTFNDFYRLTDGDVTFIIHHPPESDFENLVEMIKQLFPQVDFSEMAFGGSAIPESCFRFFPKEHDVILLTPFDDEICHTEYLRR